ncbi:MAG: peptidase family protein [Phycisphaerales bacterium]|nr:peptidase family protein [Phycisphaerales bacterium]
MSNLRPTFHESWYRVADLRARLRPSAQISRQHYRGERWYVVRDPAGNQYHRLSSAAYRFVGLLDGSRTVSEAWDTAGGVLADDAPTQPEVVQILSQLHAANLLEANITADAGVLLRRHKQMMKRRLQGRFMNVLFPRIPLWDLDKFLVRWMPVMRVFLSKFGALLWIVAVVAALAAIGPEWNRLKTAGNNAIEPGNWPLLWATFVIIKLIHELGHAFSCRRFGGEVHELGIMFLVFVPAPYVDASSAWSLPSKWQRVFVGAGGMIFELFVAAICAFIWKYTDPTSIVSKLAYNTMFIASVTTILFNANPLLRYDGYYILSDLLEIPNLRQKSMEYSLGLIKRHVFRVKSAIPLPPPGQRIWLLLYAISSGIYRVFVGIMIILVVANQVPVLGVLMAIGGVITWLVVPVAKVLNYLLLQPELHRKRGRAIAFSAAVAAVIIVAIGVIRFPVHFEAPGYVEPEQKATLRARTAGFVDRIAVRDGQRVVAGQTLIACHDKELETMIAKLESDLRGIETLIQQGMVASQADRQAQEFNKAGIRKRLEYANKQREDLNVKAPFDGMVVAPMLHELQGKFLHQGEEIATVIQYDPLVIRATVDQSEAALLFLVDKPNISPFPILNSICSYNASGDEVANRLFTDGVPFTEDPAQDKRQRGESIRTIAAEKLKMPADQTGRVVFAFDNNRISTITGTFKSAGAFDALSAEHAKQLGQPEAPPTSQPMPAGQKRAHWLSERDECALDVDLTEQQGVTTLAYHILGRKVDVRLAGARSENLQARVLTRIPAAMANVPHKSMTHAGGGDQQNDPSDQTGTRVQIPVFEVRLRLDNPSLQYLPGQTAHIRFTMEKDKPLIWQWQRRFWQLIQTQSAQNKWL